MILRLVNLGIAIIVAALCLSLWAYSNRPQFLPKWPDKVTGFAFSPYRYGQDPREGSYPTLEQIDSDLKLLSGKVTAVRTYSVENNLAAIPKLAHKHNINVCLGAYLGKDQERNAEEFTLFLKTAQQNHRNVVRAMVGNETQIHGLLPYDELIDYLDKARKALTMPVSTAEPAYIWHTNPDLVEHVDFISLQILPYWEGKEVHVAVEYVFNELLGLKSRYPNKKIIISEVGWPSQGRTRKNAEASVAKQATFLRLFLQRMTKENYVYYLLEAFDQPWKNDLEGTVGAYWGVYDVNRNPKFEFFQPIVPVPSWQMLAGISILLAFIIYYLLLIDGRSLRGHGRGFLAIISYAAATAIVWIVYKYTSLYLTVGSIIVGIVLAMSLFGIVIVLLAEAHEWAEALWVKQRRREFEIKPMPDDRSPMISIHVPAYNEPAEMLIETINGLSRLDYPNFEVLVIDNNTKDEAVWRPVQEHCDKLGARFRFFHVDPLEGFKAGALNYALDHTSTEAEVIAVIDSDYVVTPLWLHDLVPQFSDPEVAVVQAPQDYSDGDNSLFKAMCYSEYAGFFYIGMVTRNERNAIIQHGTMTMVRKTALEEVGGWAEWCITEDADLGLRLFAQGYKAHYTPRSYGRGLMPDTFLDYRKQRFRWAYGAIQILRRHSGMLFGLRAGSLSLGQRYHFVAGWLPWISDGLNLLFNLAAIGWSVAMITAPMQFDPPLVIFSLLPLTLCVFKLVKLFYIYTTRIGTSMRQAIFGALAGLSLSHTISKAILQSFVTKGMPFIRTPKMANKQRLFHAIVIVHEELFLLAALWSLIGVLVTTQGVDTADMLIWVLVLLMQSLAYLSALIVSVISSFPRIPARLIGVRWIDKPDVHDVVI